MRSVAIIALLCFSISQIFAQAKSPAAAAISYDGEAVVIEQLESSFRYSPDGTGEKNSHIRVKVQTEAGARQLSVLSFPYASANESVKIQSLHVLHSDGTSTETPAADAMDMAAPVTQQAPLYSDLKVQQIPVRGLRVGDTLEFSVLIERKNAESPGQFWDKFSFTKNAVVLAEKMTLDVPADKYVQVWSPTLTPIVSEKAGRRIYEWSGNQLKPTPSGQKKDKDPAEVAAGKKPQAAWTTFHTWQEVGDWYRALAVPRTVVTEALRAEANEITRQATTPEAQVQAIYSFVATRIRYVGVDFGVGRYQPHAAAEVLANQYGDCKDKDTLLEALLHAKGFTSAPALIGVNIDLVPEVPSPGFFNHVITTVTLPSGKLWMDTTTEIAPFQVLISELRDKDALVIPASGAAAIEHTPAQTPFPFVDHFEAVATLKADGELTGHVEANFRSDRELLVRLIARNIAPAQWDKGSQYLANILGFSGTTSNSNFARAEDTGTPMRVSYDYTKKPFGDWDNLRIVPLFPVLTLPEAPEKQPTEQINLGALRKESSISRIRLPENFGAALPDAVHVKTAFATYDKTYKLEGGELTAEKTLVVLQSKLPVVSWEDYKKFAKDISLGGEMWVQLNKQLTVAKGPQRKVVGNAEAAKLITEATVLERAKDWDGALKKLDAAKKISDEQPYLWSNYAYVEMAQKKSKDAKKHFRRELELHPDESYVVTLYAGLLNRTGETEEARSLLGDFLKNHSPEPGNALLLASIEAKTSLPDAIATLRTTNEAQPENMQVWNALGDYLVRNRQNAEAAVLAKKHLDGTEDSGILNDAAYLLAKSNVDLPFAEQKTRKALEILDGQTSAATVSEANARSFERSSLLAAAWDTLGFILLGQNKLDEARDYMEASWKNRPDREIGEHYALLLEKQGDANAALRIYELCRSLRGPETSQKSIDSSIERLKKAGASSMVGSDATLVLQQERVFKMKFRSPCHSFCSATFRLQLAAGSSLSLMRVSGEALLDEAKETIKQLTLPHLVPTHSAGRILRDAVLSCSAGTGMCDFSLMPLGNIKAERAGD